MEDWLWSAAVCVCAVDFVFVFVVLSSVSLAHCRYVPVRTLLFGQKRLFIWSPLAKLVTDPACIGRLCAGVLYMYVGTINTSE